MLFRTPCSYAAGRPSARHGKTDPVDCNDREIGSRFSDDDPGIRSAVLGAMGETYRAGEAGVGLGFVHRQDAAGAGRRPGGLRQPIGAGERGSGAMVAITGPSGILDAESGDSGADGLRRMPP